MNRFNMIAGMGMILAMVSTSAEAGGKKRYYHVDCRYHGEQTGKDKGKGGVIDCRARAKFSVGEHDETMDQMSLMAMGDKHSYERLKVVCNGEELYDNGLDLVFGERHLRIQPEESSTPAILLPIHHGGDSSEDRHGKKLRASWLDLGDDGLVRGHCRIERCYEHDHENEYEAVDHADFL